MEGAAAGISPIDFWDMTWREYYAAIRGYRQRKLHDMKTAVMGGYYAGMIGRAKNPPSLRTLLNRLDPPPPMAPQTMRRAITAINSAMGGRVRYVPKGTIRGG